MDQDIYTTQQKLAQSNAANVSVPDFLLKTYQLLEENKYSSYVSWSKDGTMIIIKKPLAFSEEVLPIFFKHSNLSSFIRQLNNYSFRKMKSKEYEYCFYHEMFRRDRRDLLKHIKRKKVIRPKSQRASRNSHSRKAAPQVQTNNVPSDIIESPPAKKVHAEEPLSAPNKNVQENQIAYLRQANQQLREELLKRQAQDRSLRHVISIITNYYGTENIQNVLKMAEMAKDSIYREQPVVQNESNNLAKLFHQPPDAETLNNDLFDDTAKPVKTEHANSFSSFGNDPFASLQQDNSFHAEGMETADNYSSSPRMGDEPGTNYKCMLDHPITDINTKMEPDFFRGDSSDLQSYPYSSLANPF